MPVQARDRPGARSLRLGIGALLALGLALLWGGIALHLGTVHRAALRGARSAAANLDRAFEEHILRTVKGVDEALFYFRTGYAADPTHFDFARAFKNSDATGDIAIGIVVVGKDGHVVWGSLPGHYIGHYVGDRDFFTWHVRHGADRLYIGRPVIGKVSGKPIVQLSRRIVMPGGSFGGVVNISLDPTYLTAFYNSIDLGPGGAIAVVGTDGIVRARSAGAPFTLGQDIRDARLMREAARAPRGVFRMASPFDLRFRTVAYRSLPRLPLIVAVAISDADALIAYGREKRAALAAGIAASIVLLGAALLLAAQLSRLQEAKRLLQENEARMRLRLAEIRSIHDAVPFGIALVDSDLALLSTNRWLQRFHDADGTQPAGRSLRDLAPAAADRLEPACRRVFAEGTATPPVDVTVDAPAAGALCHWRVTFCPVADDGGRVVAASVVVQDITAQNAHEAALRESEARYRLLADNSTDVIVRSRLDGARLYISPSVRQILGYEPEELVPGSSFTLIHPEDAAPFAAAVRSLVPNGSGTTLVYRLRRKSGHYIWAEVAMRLVTGPDWSPEVVGAIRDISDRRRSEEALRLAKEEAEAASRAKSAFLANMSHELRTPLNAIIGFSQIIRDGLFGPIGARYRDYANDVHSSGQHLLRLINEVLDLSKIEVGRVEVHEEEVRLPDVIESCRRLLAPKAEAARVAIDTVLPPDLPSIFADHLRLKQIVLNLLSNAVKFTLPGGHVTVAARPSPAGGVDLAIADTGIGMSADEIPVALAPFEQIESALTRRHEGTGLGLPLAKALTELHGGTLAILSEKGVGTTVTVHLPKTRVLVPPSEGPLGHPARAPA